MLQKMIVAGLTAAALVGATAAQAQALSTDMRASESQLAPAPAKKAVKHATPSMNGSNKADGDDNHDGTIVAVLAAGAIAGGVIAATSNTDTKVNSPN